MQETCIVIPLFNEEKRLDVTRFSNFLQENPCHFYFVNDGSKDQTLNLLEKMERSFPGKVKVLDLKNNFGKAEAVRQGVLTALGTLEEISFLLNYLKAGPKIVIGSRVKRLGSKITRTPKRHYLGRIFATVASLVLSIKVYDSQCGAKIFEKNTARILFSEPFVSKWLFDLELIYKFKNLDPVNFENEILETPLRSWTEQKGSKIELRDLVKVPIELYKIRRKK